MSEMRPVRAGPVTALLDGGFLRRIRVGGQEIVRGVYAAVRDQNWATIEPRYTRFEVTERPDSFSVALAAEHHGGDVDFAWQGTIEGNATGQLIFTFDGVARRTFRKNRIGFCVLHPPDVAGTSYTRVTPNGAVEERFPTLISPSREVVDMAALRYSVGPIAVEVAFEGDLFDMEDQRNWTDASFKTFCTPLRRPYPALLGAGSRIEQRVTINVRGVDPPDSSGGSGEDVIVTSTVVGPLPAIGLGAPEHGRAIAVEQGSLLRVTRPAHLRVELDPRAGAWRERLTAAAEDAGLLGAAIEVALVSDADGAGIEEAVAALVGLGVPVVRLSAYQEGSSVTTAGLLAKLRAAADAHGLVAGLGGGSRADFYQLNAAAGRVPLAELDFVAWAVNPQVHTFDDMSIVENAGAQGPTVTSAAALAPGRTLAVGPVTLRPRFNAAATEPNAPKPPPDPRQSLPFAAAWTVASLRALTSSGTSALTYYETTGPGGILSEGGDPYPVHAVLAAVGDMAGGELLAVQLTDPLAVEALALRKDGRARVLAANVTPTARTARVRTAGGVRKVELEGYGVAVLDEPT